MNLKKKVIFLLNTNKDFVDFSVEYFDVTLLKIEIAVNCIIDKTVSALNVQCSKNGKSAELVKIAKECKALTFGNYSNNLQDIVSKGRGVNSEIFGINLVHIVDGIAKSSKLKNGVVNALISMVTPAVLNVIYTESINVNDDKEECSDIFCKYVKGINFPKRILAKSNITYLK